MAPYTLAHLSDPHLPPLPKPRLIELAGKRALGYVNWTRNRHKYQRREVLDALVTDVRAQAPDHIAVTGDLVNLALEAEFAPARACHPRAASRRGRFRGAEILPGCLAKGYSKRRDERAGAVVTDVERDAGHVSPRCRRQASLA